MIETDGVMSRCVFGTTVLAIPEDLAFEEWASLIQQVNEIRNASLWWLGDALVFGESHYEVDDTAFVAAVNHVLADTGVEIATVRLCRQTAMRFQPSERVEDVGFELHSAASADVDPALALGMATETGMSAQQLRRHLRQR